MHDELGSFFTCRSYAKILQFPSAETLMAIEGELLQALNYECFVNKMDFEKFSLAIECYNNKQVKNDQQMEFISYKQMPTKEKEERPENEANEDIWKRVATSKWEEMEQKKKVHTIFNTHSSSLLVTFSNNL